MISMSLLDEIFVEVSADTRMRLLAPNLAQLTEQFCYRMLEEIQNIIRDDQLDDPECFARIEQIVCLFEKHGISTGGRHDF
ncbi:MAG TPA: hypothetical protein IAB55_12400 [Candidatus Merdivicinus faecavium]|nr:hypothetical protein [Candidatus Merdivicinus faecavium]